jgi:hypothetical protein
MHEYSKDQFARVIGSSDRSRWLCWRDLSARTSLSFFFLCFPRTIHGEQLRFDIVVHVTSVRRVASPGNSSGGDQNYVPFFLLPDSLVFLKKRITG